MASTVITYPLNDSRQYRIPFDYLSRKFVEVRLKNQNGEVGPLLVNLQHYRFGDKTTIVLFSDVNTGEYDSIEIRRNTSATERVVDFSDGTILRASDLNASQIQAIHIVEEVRGQTISDMTELSELTKMYRDQALTYRDESSAFSESAEAARDATIEAIQKAGDRSTLAYLALPDGAAAIGIKEGGKLSDVIDEYTLDALGMVDFADATSKLEQVVAWQALTGYKIRQSVPRRYTLSGNKKYYFSHGVDLSGVTWVPDSSFKGVVGYKGPDELKVYDSSTPEGAALLAKINSSSSKSKSAQSAILDGLIGDSTLNGCYVQLKGPDVLFTARGNPKTWVHTTRLSRDGQMDHAMKYSFSSITSVRALPVRTSGGYTKVNLGVIDMQNSPHNGAGMLEILNGSRIEVEGMGVINKPIVDTASNVLLKLDTGWNVRVKDYYDQWPNDSWSSGVSVYSYGLNFNNIVGLHVINFDSQGAGWGTTAGADCTDTTFEGCNLNRVDFHSPFWGFLRVIRCNLGNHAFSVCGCGDRLSIKDCKVTFHPGGRDNGILKGRDDQGGFMDCDLEIDGLVIDGELDDDLGMLRSGDDGTGGVPAGSPVTPRFFRNVSMRNVRWQARKETARFANLISASRDGSVWFPESVILENFDFNSGDDDGSALTIGFTNFKQKRDFDNTANPLTVPFTTHIKMTDISTSRVLIRGAGVSHNPRVVIENLRDLRAGKMGSTLEITQRGSYKVSDSQIKKLYLSSAFTGMASPNGYCDVDLVNTDLVNPTESPIGNIQDLHSISMTGGNLMAPFGGTSDTSIARAIARAMTLRGVTLRGPDGAQLANAPLWSGLIGSTEAPIDGDLQVRWGNRLSVTSYIDSTPNVASLFVEGTTAWHTLFARSAANTSPIRLDLRARAGRSLFNSVIGTPEGVRTINITGG